MAGPRPVPLIHLSVPSNSHSALQDGQLPWTPRSPFPLCPPLAGRTSPSNGAELASLQLSLLAGSPRWDSHQGQPVTHVMGVAVA